MKYFIDTEFNERGPKFPIQLISIGIVSEDGREYYAHNREYSVSDCSEWLKINVLPYLENIESKSLISIGNEIRFFVGEDKPEFWGYYADYDWVVFCQIFGTMLDLPKGWPMYCNDLKQYSKLLGDIKLPKQTTNQHDALNDAKWVKFAFNYLKEF